MVEIPEKLKPYQYGVSKSWVKTHYKFNKVPICLWFEILKLRKKEKELNQKKDFINWEQKFANQMSWEEYRKMPKM